MKFPLITISFLIIIFSAQAQVGVSGPDYVPPFSKDGKKLYEHYPSNGGTDFWGINATHVPLSPIKNIMPNPGFEQGFHYWGWMYGGGEYTPAPKRHFAISPSGLSGKALLIRANCQPIVEGLMSTPLPLNHGQTYTVSCYAKSEKPDMSFTFCMVSATTMGKEQFGWQNLYKKTSQHRLSTEWKRFSITFTHQNEADCVFLNVLGEKKPCNIFIDNIQVEKGTKATDYVAPEVEGCLRLSSPYHLLTKKDKLDAKFEIIGKAPGTLKLTLLNFFREKLWEGKYQLPLNHGLDLPFDTLKLGKGSFCLKAEFQLDNNHKFYDYFRFSIIESLNEPRKTRIFFGTNFVLANAWSDIVCKMLSEIGYGSTNMGGGVKCYPNKFHLLEKYKIHRSMMLKSLSKSETVSVAEMDYLRRIHHKDKITKEDEVKIEDICYRLVKEHPYLKAVSLSGESETHPGSFPAKGEYEEFAKIQIASYKGAKRANPDIIVLPDKGTSCFMRSRGYPTMEGYLRATQDKVKWDAIGIHPYYALDGTSVATGDFDETIKLLIGLMKKYGYGKDTSIYLNESFNIPVVNVPGWCRPDWGDTYRGSKPTYDFSLHEYNQAAWIARIYIMWLKYWPQVQVLNTWRSRFFQDANLVPFAKVNAVNTVASLFKDCEYICDFKPTIVVRGYVFQNQDKKTVAAIWCADTKVEKGLTRGPKLCLTINDPSLELVDLMGNSRKIVSTSNQINLQLGAAPIFLLSQNKEKLIKALSASQLSATVNDLKINVMPDIEGKVMLDVSNKAMAKCDLRYDNTTFEIPGGKSRSNEIKRETPAYGKLFDYNTVFNVKYENQKEHYKKWAMEYFYVPYCLDKPHWDKIPAFPVDRYYATSKPKEEEFSAKFKIAWNEKELFLRVKAFDNEIISISDKLEAALNKRGRYYYLDTCVEVYFDALANGRSNINEGFDKDDYRYDFIYGPPYDISSSIGRCYRLRTPGMQFAGGLFMPTQEEVLKNVRCVFTRVNENEYIYDITIPQRYLQPFQLKEGSYCGFGLCIHDKRENKLTQLLSTATGGGHCNMKPHVWPLMILSKEKASSF